MPKWYILAALVAVGVSGLAYAAKSNRPGIAVAAVQAPISILELTVKSSELPVQEATDAI
jgi:hypothetical protein